MTLPLLLALKRCTAAEREAVGVAAQDAAPRARARRGRPPSAARPRARAGARRRAALPRRRGHRAPRRRARAPRAHRDRALPRRRRQARPARGCRVRASRATASASTSLSPRDRSREILPCIDSHRSRGAAFALAAAPRARGRAPRRARGGELTRRREREHRDAPRSSQLLPGIGASRAQAIIEAREAARRLQERRRSARGEGHRRGEPRQAAPAPDARGQDDALAPNEAGAPRAGGRGAAGPGTLRAPRGRATVRRDARAPPPAAIVARLGRAR